MRSLKILVVALGILLLGGTAVLVAVVVERIAHRPAAAAVSRGPLRTLLPEGARILGSELAGDRLLVRLALADGSEALALFDARTGAELAVIEQRAAPKP
jgi:hypothetical protein